MAVVVDVLCNPVEF